MTEEKEGRLEVLGTKIKGGNDTDEGSLINKGSRSAGPSSKVDSKAKRDDEGEKRKAWEGQSYRIMKQEKTQVMQ